MYGMASRPIPGSPELTVHSFDTPIEHPNMEVITNNHASTIAMMPKFAPTVTLESVSSSGSSSPATTASAPTSRTTSASEDSAIALSAPPAVPRTTVAPLTKALPDLHIVTVPATVYKAAAACLAQAFAADPMAAYFLDCPDTQGWSEKRKWALHRRIFEYVTYAHCCHGLVRAVESTAATPAKGDGDAAASGKAQGPTYDAVALWMPPGASMDGWRAALRGGLWRQHLRTRWALSREGRTRLFEEFFPMLHRAKEEVLAARDPEAWYLVYLGTHERARGRGLASRLVREVTSQVRLSSFFSAFAVKTFFPFD